MHARMPCVHGLHSMQGLPGTQLAASAHKIIDVRMRAEGCECMMISLGMPWMKRCAVHLECSPWTAVDLKLFHSALIAAAVCMLYERLYSWHGFTLTLGLTEPSHGRKVAWVYVSTYGVLPPQPQPAGHCEPIAKNDVLALSSLYACHPL